MGSEGSEAIRVLQEAIEEYRRERKGIREEVKTEQERLRAEDRADQERLRDCLITEIEASRITMEEHAQANEELCKTNEELRRSLHRLGRCPGNVPPKFVIDG